jgi:hypothetical protein
MWICLFGVLTGPAPCGSLSLTNVHFITQRTRDLIHHIFNKTATRIFPCHIWYALGGTCWVISLRGKCHASGFAVVKIRQLLSAIPVLMCLWDRNGTLMNVMGSTLSLREVSQWGSNCVNNNLPIIRQRSTYFSSSLPYVSGERVC